MTCFREVRDGRAGEDGMCWRPWVVAEGVVWCVVRFEKEDGWGVEKGERLRAGGVVACWAFLGGREGGREWYVRSEGGGW